MEFFNHFLFDTSLFKIIIIITMISIIRPPGIIKATKTIAKNIIIPFIVLISPVIVLYHKQAESVPDQFYL